LTFLLNALEGAIPIKVPRPHDRNALKGISNLLSPYVRRSKSVEMALIIVFKLIKNAEQTWRRLHGSQQLAKVISGVKFSDGSEDTVHKQLVAA